MRNGNNVASLLSAPKSARPSLDPKGGTVAKQPAPKEKKRPKNDAAQAAKKAKKAAKKAGGGTA